MTRFLDTNILLYSISTDPDESEKRLFVEAALAEPGNALSVQVLQEFYVQSTRTTRRNPVSHEMAAKLMGTWSRFPLQPITPELMFLALEIRERYQFSYWDAAVVAAAQTLGCSELWSEDMQHTQAVGSVTIVNPFLDTAQR